MILDSRIGALDRTLGFLFGLARGLLIVVVAFLFFAWLVPDKQQPDWVSERQVARGAARHRRMADVDVAGRPREHHLEAVQEEKPEDGKTDADPARRAPAMATASLPATA